MRIGRDAMLMEMARRLAKRSMCTRRQVGALAAVEGRVLATDYNRAPSGQTNCIDRGNCVTDGDGGCRDSVHAKANLVAFAAKHGIALRGATVYTTCAPCVDCAKLLINAGIVRVVYGELYRDPKGLSLLESSGVVVQWYMEGQEGGEVDGH